MKRSWTLLGLLILCAMGGCSDSSGGDGTTQDAGGDVGDAGGDGADVDGGGDSGVGDVDAGGTNTGDAGGEDACPDDPKKTEAGECGCGVVEATSDTDDDGDIDCLDTDDDADGVDDADDTTPLDANACGDTDGDGCDDCKSGKSDPADDGADADADGICDKLAGTTYHFTTCGMVGMNGPSQAACDNSYTSTPLAGKVVLDSGYQRFMVPEAGAYRIVARGASGGTTNTVDLGGFGAQVTGLFTFKQNDELVIVVGQRGAEKPGCSDYGGGGGGGTFVTRKKTGGDTVSITSPVDVEPLIIAGGGGGASDNGQGCLATDQPQSAVNADSTQSGDGSGGVGDDAGGGGGYAGDGTNASTNGGKAFVNGSLGSSDYQPGGFGGGAGGYNDGGSGGGYTGGSASTTGGNPGIAGGGSSFNVGATPKAELRTAFGDGDVFLIRVGGVDHDGDTVLDDDDADAEDAHVCTDADGDNCDDCAVAGAPEVDNDGADADGNGVCDHGESVDSFSFGACDQTGVAGPSQGQCDTAYDTGALKGDVTVTSGYQRWTVATSGMYRITASGAQGGKTNGTDPGGKGAVVSGLFKLNKGDKLVIVVGQVGENDIACSDGGGGGGASYVTMVMAGGDTVVPLAVEVVPLVVAAGGAGAGGQNLGCDGTQERKYYDGSASFVGDGQGGLSEWSEGGGGGGYFGDGENGDTIGGLAFLNGATGADDIIDGGFGGGAASAETGGSGGGYTGGTTWSGYVAKGGYSFCDGAAPQGQDGKRAGAGAVIIERLPN